MNLFVFKDFVANAKDQLKSITYEWARKHHDKLGFCNHFSTFLVTQPNGHSTNHTIDLRTSCKLPCVNMWAYVIPIFFDC